MLGSQIRVFITVVLLVCAPTLIALTIHHFTRDPEMRPLGLDIKDFDDNWSAENKPLAVAAHVYLSDRLQTKENQQQLAGQIKQSFSVRNIPSVVYFHKATPGHLGEVVFEVGQNRFGPYYLTNAAMGIKPAVAAFRQTSRALDISNAEQAE